jgi:hypothetical protein
VPVSSPGLGHPGLWRSALRCTPTCSCCVRDRRRYGPAALGNRLLPPAALPCRPAALPLCPPASDVVLHGTQHRAAHTAARHAQLCAATAASMPRRTARALQLGENLRQRFHSASPSRKFPSPTRRCPARRGCPDVPPSCRWARGRQFDCARPGVDPSRARHSTGLKPELVTLPSWRYAPQSQGSAGHFQGSLEHPPHL